MYKRSISLLRTSVPESFIVKNQSDRHKIPHVQRFLHVYMDLTSSLNKTLFVVRFHVDSFGHEIIISVKQNNHH